jgi:hypothetical protein
MQEGPPSSMQTKASPRTASSPPPSSPPAALSPRSKTAAAGSKGVPAAQAASAPLTPTSSGTSSSADDEVEDADWAWDAGHVPWYCQPRKLAVVVLLLVSVGLVLAGLVLQVVFRDPEGLTKDFEDVYTFFYFVAGTPPVALLLRWLCWRLYAVSCMSQHQHTAATRSPDCFALHGLWFDAGTGHSCHELC